MLYESFSAILPYFQIMCHEFCDFWVEHLQPTHGSRLVTLHCEGSYTHRGYRLDVKINLPQDGQFVRTLSANRVPKRSETPILHTRRSRPLLGRVFSAFYNGPRPPFENWNLAFLCLNKFFPDKPISISIQSCCACVRISRECVPEVGGKSRGLALFWEGMGSSP